MRTENFFQLYSIFLFYGIKYQFLLFYGITVLFAVVFCLDFNVLGIRSIRRSGFSPKAKAAKVEGSLLSWVLQRLYEFPMAAAGRDNMASA